MFFIVSGCVLAGILGGILFADRISAFAMVILSTLFYENFEKYKGDKNEKF